MIIVNIKGGLGNQLFQYAAAKRLALKHNSPLKLDPHFEKDKLRDFKLPYFNIDNDEIATQEEIDRLIISFRRYNNIYHKIKRKLELLKPYYKRRYYQHKKRCNDLGILKASDNVYLDGYWGNEQFFSDIRQKLLSWFTLKPDYINDDYLEIKNKTKEENSVSIHIRRGDYAQKEKTRNFFGLLPLSYYQKAINSLEKQFENLHFFIFSDDMPYVKQNINFEGTTTYINNPNLQDYHELMLMSHCKHNIIANSTFSWWAAWLNQNPEKMVIAPHKWYNNEEAQRYFEKYSFVPDGWMKI